MIHSTATAVASVHGLTLLPADEPHAEFFSNLLHMHKRTEHLTVLTNIFSPDTAADGSEICPILPSPSFLSRQKSVPLKLRAPKTDYFCRDSLRTTQEYREYFKEDETGYRQKEPFSASGFGSLMHNQEMLIRTCRTENLACSLASQANNYYSRLSINSAMRH